MLIIVNVNVYIEMMQIHFIYHVRHRGRLKYFVSRTYELTRNQKFESMVTECKAGGHCLIYIAVSLFHFRNFKRVENNLSKQITRPTLHTNDSVNITDRGMRLVLRFTVSVTILGMVKVRALTGYKRFRYGYGSASVLDFGKPVKTDFSIFKIQ